MSRFANLAMAAALALGAWLPGSSVAADLQVYREVDPGICGEKKVRGTIAVRFRYQVLHVPNLPDVEILSFRNIRQNRYEPATERWPISRRYCAAQVHLSDGRSRPIWYLIEGDMGYASIGDNVEFCVSGFDRWMVYNGGCRVLRALEP